MAGELEGQPPGSKAKLDRGPLVQPGPKESFQVATARHVREVQGLRAKWQRGWWHFVSVPCGKAWEHSSQNIPREEPGARALPGGGTVGLVPSGLLSLPWARGTESDARLLHGPASL